MKKELKYIGWCLGMLALLLAGCADHDLPAPLPEAEEEPEYRAHAVFQLNIGFDDNSGATRAAAPDSTPGNTMERRVSKLHLFIVPMVQLPGEPEREEWSQAQQVSVNVSENYTNPISVGVDEVISGRLNVYVGANLSDAQAESFLTSEDHDYRMSSAGALQYYYGSINQFAPFKTDRAEAAGAVRNPENIVMFGREPLRVNLAPTSEEGETEEVIHLGSVQLKRMVAKVLATCVTLKGSEATGKEVALGALPDTGYVKTTNEETGRQLSGWIRQKDVYFFINNMPRNANFIQSYTDKDGDGIRETLVPHYNLREALNSLQTEFTPLKFHEDNISRVFIHYDQLVLFQRNWSYQQTGIWSQDEYDKLISKTQHNRSEYSRPYVGLYTLENVFGVEDGDFTPAEWAQLENYEALPMLTHVSIATKFTPKVIYVARDEWINGAHGAAPIKDKEFGGQTLEDFTDTLAFEPFDIRYVRLQCANEAVAQEILTASLRIHDHLLLPTGTEYDPQDEPYQYPAQTFFAYFGAKEDAFCSYGAAALGNNYDRNWPEMVPYTGGWSYYYTYINNEDNAPITDLSQSCIERNRYYILRINSISTLGSTVSDPRYIKVYTMKSKWGDGGEGTLELH